MLTGLCEGIDRRSAADFVLSSAFLHPLYFSTALQQSRERLDQDESGRAQLFETQPGDMFKQAFPAREQGDQHLAAVLTAAGTDNVSLGFQAVDQFDRAMVPQEKLFGEGADGGRLPRGEPADCQKHLILPRLEPRLFRSSIASAQKLANAVAELGERLVLPVFYSLPHIITISYYDIRCQRKDNLRDSGLRGGADLHRIIRQLPHSLDPPSGFPLARRR